MGSLPLTGQHKVLGEGIRRVLSLVERVPKPLRILCSIKLGFLYRVNKQINERFIYEKVNVHNYYSLETDVPALQGAHTAAWRRVTGASPRMPRMPSASSVINP